MRPWRWVFVIALVAGLVWAAWRMSSDTDAAPTTTALAVPSTTTSNPPPASTSTTVAVVTSTTQAVSREEEVKAILEGLWFGWFDAIYRKDEEALWKVVATQKNFDTGLGAMSEDGVFASAPRIEDVRILTFEVLLDRPDCLVVDQRVDVSAFRNGPGEFATVSVLWPGASGGWRLASQWQHANDLWLHDCDDLAREPTP